MNAGVSYHFLLQGIFLTQGSNQCLLHWQAGSLPLSHQGSLCVSFYLQPLIWSLSPLRLDLKSTAFLFCFNGAPPSPSKTTSTLQIPKMEANPIYALIFFYLLKHHAISRISTKMMQRAFKLNWAQITFPPILPTTLRKTFNVTVFFYKVMLTKPKCHS